MSDLRAVLGYLADIASGDDEITPNVGKVTFTQCGPIFAENRAHHDMLRTLAPLAAADKLHKEEHLVWEGRLWILGSIDGVSHRWPIMRRRISFTDTLRRLAGIPLVRPESGWALTPGLVSDASIADLGEADVSWMETMAIPESGSFSRERYPRLNRLVEQYLAAAGIRRLPVTTLELIGADPDPQVSATRGFYLDRHPYQLDRPSVLKLWQGHELDATPLSALYQPVDSPAEANDDQSEPIQSPLPVNRSQRRAIATTRNAPLSVVSGPPGTGKSHLVAAAAIDQVAAGHSVLVASQSVHACDVVVELLQRYPMVEALRFGNDGSARHLGDKLAAGVPDTDGEFDPRHLAGSLGELAREVAAHRARLVRRITELGGFEQALVRRHDVPVWLASRDLSAINLDAARSARDDLDAGGLFGWLTRRRARQTLRNALGRDLRGPELDDVLDAVAAEQLVASLTGRDLRLDELWHELDRLEERWRGRIGDLLEARRRDRAGHRNRSALNELAAALRLGPIKRREVLNQLGASFLEIVPLWVGTLNEIEATLPVQPGLFDLVILDESSQISQISAVPALARAKRAMIVGDSRQLRHVSFMSDARQGDAAAKHGLSPTLTTRLNDRTNSLFDAATAVAPVVQLDEHFRSAPHIISFSDRNFYDGKLRLMTQHPRNEARDAIDLITVEGRRNKSRVVEAEVNEVLRQIRSLIADGVTSIGIVSPFRAQAEAIEARIIDEFTLEEIDRHRLRVGTVHSFQGTERDHIVISVGVGPKDRRALAFVEDPAVFNVMVTRARNHVTIITTLNRKTAGSGLLGQYLRHGDEPPSLRPATVAASGWTERVASELSTNTAQRVITGYEVAGERIDIVVGSDASAIGIETEIHPDGPEAHIERRLALARAGWQIESLHRATCYGREEEAIASLLARFG